MSAGTVAGIAGRRPLPRLVPRAEPWCLPDCRRVLQLSLAALWLFDGVLQLQPVMFTPAFGSQMVAPMARGNPTLVANLITWSAHEMARHATLAGIAFAGVQLLIAAGIAWRPTVKPALAFSMVWAFGVWWVGEGFGGLLNGGANPLTGAPGAVVLYALLAVLLWPRPSEGGTEEFVAARPFGPAAARIVWAVVWWGMAALAFLPVNRAPQSARNAIVSAAAGQPHWLSDLETGVARELAGRGLAVSVALAVTFALIGVAIFFRGRPVRFALVAAIVAAVVIWVVGEGFGGIFSGSGTDPNSGPLLVLLAAAYWPLRRRTSILAPAAVASAAAGGTRGSVPEMAVDAAPVAPAATGGGR